MVEKSPANAGDTRDTSLIREDPLEEEIVTHSSIPAWKIPTVHGVTESDTTEQLRSGSRGHLNLASVRWKAKEPKSVSDTNLRNPP